VGHHSEAFIGIDTSKSRNAVAIAEGGRGGEVRFLGEFPTTEAATRKLVAKLAAKYDKLTFCYEAGPTGYGLYRRIKSLDHECIVVAPSLTPKKPGERVKTNRRDAVGLARLLRAGELTAVWVPDERHEAMRDLSRARQAVKKDLQGHVTWLRLTSNVLARRQFLTLWQRELPGRGSPGRENLRGENLWGERISGEGEFPGRETEY
jgi:transposase